MMTGGEKVRKNQKAAKVIRFDKVAKTKGRNKQEGKKPRKKSMNESRHQTGYMSWDVIVRNHDEKKEYRFTHADCSVIFTLALVKKGKREGMMQASVFGNEMELVLALDRVLDDYPTVAEKLVSIRMMKAITQRGKPRNDED